MACAFLPESLHTRRLAEMAFAARKEILIHLRLEPSAGPAHPLALSAQTPPSGRDDRRNGGALAIGHPYAQTCAVLSEMPPRPVWSWASG